MSKTINEILNKMYHDMAIEELGRAYSKEVVNNLSYHDVLYLNIIEAHPNEYTSSKIADLLGITRPSVTQKINELCKKGYVVRTQSEIDKRVYYLKSANEAKKLFDESTYEVNEAEKMLLNKYGVEKLNIFLEMLEELSMFSIKDDLKGNKND